MSFFARLLGRNADGTHGAAKAGGGCVAVETRNGSKRSAPSSPGSGSFAPELLPNGRQAPTAALKLQANATTLQQRRSSVEDEDDDCTCVACCGRAPTRAALTIRTSSSSSRDCGTGPVA
jgi:hypothetical protein